MRRTRIFCYVKKLHQKIDYDITIYTEQSALEVKNTIGNCYAVISRRYHGVANALNTGVPCLLTSWSYKYEYLFKEYNLLDRLVDLNGDLPYHKLKSLINRDVNRNERDNLLAAKKSVQKRTKYMWNQVFNVIQ